MSDRGKFIAFEGIDGSGKTTQSQMLGDLFLSIKQPFCWTTEPDWMNAIGVFIREQVLTGKQQFAKKAEALLFVADRAEHIAKTIEPLLDRGTNVICDRYLMSTFAYQYPGNSWEFLGKLHTDLPLPDLTFLIDIPLGTAMERIKARSTVDFDPFERRNILEQANNNYNRIAGVLTAEDWSEAHPIVHVNGDQSQQELHQHIVNTLVEYGILPDYLHQLYEKSH